MDTIDNQIRRALISQWDRFKLCMAKLNPSASVRPNDGYTVFSHAETRDDTSTFEVTPAAMNVPERAGYTSTDLYVVVAGYLSIDRRHFRETRQVRTQRFGTRVAYFRIKSGVLQHVYGAHYDFSESETGHPVFHGQMGSFVEFAETAREQFRLEYLEISDAMKGVLSRVRLPSAQMDIFSSFIQVLADHLLSKSSSEAERLSFGELLDGSATIQGAGFAVPRLQGPPASHCYRAIHWYPPNP